MTELSNLLFIVQMCMQLAIQSELQPSDAFRCDQTANHMIEYHFDGDIKRFQRYVYDNTINDYPKQ